MMNRALILGDERRTFLKMIGGSAVVLPLVGLSA